MQYGEVQRGKNPDLYFLVKGWGSAEKLFILLLISGIGCLQCARRGGGNEKHEGTWAESTILSIV